MSDKDITIGLTLNDTPFTRAMDKARARMKQTIQEMEQSSKMSMDMLERRIARSVGSSAVREHPLYLRHAESIYWRDRYPAERGLGQELVAPGQMSRSALDAVNIQRSEMSLGRMHKSLMLVQSAAAGVNIALSLWKGNIKEAQEKLERLPGIIGEAARIGGDLAPLGVRGLEWWFEKAGKWLPPSMSARSILGKGPQSDYLKSILPGVPAEQAQADLSLLAKQWSDEAALMQASEGERARHAIEQRYQAKVRQYQYTSAPLNSPEYIAATLAAEKAKQVELEQLAQAEAAAEARRAQEQADREREMHEQRLAEEQRYADELDDLRADVAERELTRQDRALEAQRVRIRANYGVRIREAERAGQEEKARMLELLRDMEVGMVHGTHGRAGSFATINTAYVAPEGLGMGQQDYKMNRLIGLTEEQTREIKRLVEAMTGDN